MQNSDNKMFLEDFVISLEDFKYLNSLYKFIPIRETLSFTDRKHNKNVAYVTKNLFSDKDEIHFNLNWLAYEIIITKDKKLIDIFNKYIENSKKFEQIKFILDNIKESDRKYIQSFSYINYNPSKDDIEHYKLSQYETLITTLQELL